MHVTAALSLESLYYGGRQRNRDLLPPERCCCFPQLRRSLWDAGSGVIMLVVPGSTHHLITADHSISWYHSDSSHITSRPALTFGSLDFPQPGGAERDRQKEEKKWKTNFTLGRPSKGWPQNDLSFWICPWSEDNPDKITDLRLDFSWYPPSSKRDRSCYCCRYSPRRTSLELSLLSQRWFSSRIHWLRSDWISTVQPADTPSLQWFLPPCGVSWLQLGSACQ